MSGALLYVMNHGPDDVITQPVARLLYRWQLQQTTGMRNESPRVGQCDSSA